MSLLFCRQLCWAGSPDPVRQEVQKLMRADLQSSRTATMRCSHIIPTSMHPCNGCLSVSLSCMAGRGVSRLWSWLPCIRATKACMQMHGDVCMPRMHAPARMHPHECIHVHASACKHMHLHASACIHMHLHASACIHMQASACACI